MGTGTARLRVLAMGMAGLVAGGALALWYEGRFQDPPPGSTTELSVAVAATMAPVAETDVLCVDVLHLASGEAPVSLLTRAGIDMGTVHDLLSVLGGLVNLRAVQPRDEFRLFHDRSGELARLEYQRHPERSYSVSPGETGYVAACHEAPVEVSVRRIEGTVEASLYQAVLAGGGDDGLVVSFADLFQWSFDFATDTRTGDAFDLLVEERTVDGNRVGFGRLLAARYRPERAATAFAAFYHAPAGDGSGGYYDADGESIRRKFLKSPLNYSRISSHFTHRRMHPILKKARPHLGIDYAAPTGTPVVALGSGKVVFAGWIQGFGNTVKVQHDKTYLTQYAHLSKFAKGIRKGTRVDQNQVIAFVGSTGMATGPHLDFRVQQSGAWINPLRLEGGRSEPLPLGEREVFLTQVAAWTRELDAGPAGFAAVAGPESDLHRLDTVRGD